MEISRFVSSFGDCDFITFFTVECTSSPSAVSSFSFDSDLEVVDFVALVVPLVILSVVADTNLYIEKENKCIIILAVNGIPGGSNESSGTHYIAYGITSH